MPQSKRSQFNQVNDVLAQLHESGVVNLDKSLTEVLAAKEALGRLAPGSDVATAVIAWDGYGLVIKSDVADLSELANVAEALRGASGGGS